MTTENNSIIDDIKKKYPTLYDILINVISFEDYETIEEQEKEMELMAKAIINEIIEGE